MDTWEASSMGGTKPFVPPDCLHVWRKSLFFPPSLREVWRVGIINAHFYSQQKKSCSHLLNPFIPIKGDLAKINIWKQTNISLLRQAGSWSGGAEWGRGGTRKGCTMFLRPSMGYRCFWKLRVTAPLGWPSPRKYTIQDCSVLGVHVTYSLNTKWIGSDAKCFHKLNFFPAEVYVVPACLLVFSRPSTFVWMESLPENCQKGP